MENIDKLKTEIENKFGKSIESSSDFNGLFLDIKQTTGKEISVSTLKRLWGYVKYNSKPRVEILSILAQYLGFRDWQDFLSSDKIGDTSDFLTKNVVRAHDLLPGQLIKIGWAPNREVLLKYEGEKMFYVEHAANSKLRSGDSFICDLLSIGEPLICSQVMREGNLLAEGYIGGRKRGLNRLSCREK